MGCLRRLRPVVSLGASGLGVALLAVLLAGRPGPVQAKRFDLVGTVVCGVASGELCPPSATVALLTDDYGSRRTLIRIDLSQISGQLLGLRQDDELALEVESARGALLQAIRLWTADQPQPENKTKDDDNPVEE